MEYQPNLERIDTQLFSTLYTSDQVISELNEQTDKINDINNKIYSIKKYINKSKSMYKTITSWLYRIDYFNLYNKYLNYSVTTPELIEMEKINDVICPELTEIEDNILNKLIILKKRSIYINKTLDKQNDALQTIQTISDIKMLL